MKEEFADVIAAISRHFGVLERDRICCGNVTVQQCTALQRLDREPVGISTLADYLGKSASATTRLIDGMERQGWLERRSHPDDGRRVQLVLTEKGQSQAKALRASTVDMAQQLLRHIDEEAQTDILGAITKLETALAGYRRNCCGAFCCVQSDLPDEHP